MRKLVVLVALMLAVAAGTMAVTILIGAPQAIAQYCPKGNC
jgi:hypothetical protein